MCVAGGTRNRLSSTTCTIEYSFFQFIFFLRRRFFLFFSIINEQTERHETIFKATLVPTCKCDTLVHIFSCINVSTASLANGKKISVNIYVLTRNFFSLLSLVGRMNSVSIAHSFTIIEIVADRFLCSFFFLFRQFYSISLHSTTKNSNVVDGSNISSNI